MIELVDKYSLIHGDTYHVKRNPRYLTRLRSAKSYECIFYRYDDADEDFVYVICNNHTIEMDVTLLDFYRYVSKKEFYAKVKEKYDQTCLNIILKRIVNDDFRW
jgi:hypothetical protein